MRETNVSFNIKDSTFLSLAVIILFLLKWKTVFFSCGCKMKRILLKQWRWRRMFLGNLKDLAVSIAADMPVEAVRGSNQTGSYRSQIFISNGTTLPAVLLHCVCCKARHIWVKTNQFIFEDDHHQHLTPTFCFASKRPHPSPFYCIISSSPSFYEC